MCDLIFSCTLHDFFSCLHIFFCFVTLAKGRTNLELREQFILADGVSQSLQPFKPKASPNSSQSSQSGNSSFNRSGMSLPATGPITKVCFYLLVWEIMLYLYNICRVVTGSLKDVLQSETCFFGNISAKTIKLENAKNF